MILEEVRALIGTAPPGYEGVEYVFVGLFALVLVSSCITFISGLFRIFGGRS